MSEPASYASNGALDLQDAHVVTELFLGAAQASRACPLRKGSTVRLPARGTLWMTGDLHDHALNYQRIIQLADLDHQPDNHLILHELMHGDYRINGRDLSVRLWARAAALQLRHPQRVHFLLSNHELAQVMGTDISKGGVSVVEAFEEGLDYLYGDQADDVRRALRLFVQSFPLAVRCPNGILCAHSLPGPRLIDSFDPGILDRDLAVGDLEWDGDAYNMIWGRDHTQAIADRLARAWNLSLFVLGHQPVESGYDTEGRSMLILGSYDSHGMALPIDLSRSYDLPALVQALVPLSSVSL